MEENYKLAKWLNDEMTETELTEFQSTPDYELYQKIRDYSSELTTEQFDEAAMLKTILSAKEKTVKVVPLYKHWIAKVAAVLVVGLGILFMYQNLTPTIYKAANGEETTFFLPDNSQVMLNSGSKIEFTSWNWRNKRNLNLEGEAYFKVAKGQKFQVETNLGNVTVLGTQFNVKARNNRFDVTCFEGKVKVNIKTQEVVLTKGHTVSFVADNKIIHQEINSNKPLWIDNQISFEKENLQNIIEEISRQYNLKIELKNSNTTQLFTGKLPENDAEIALQIIASAYHLKINKISTFSYSLEEVN